MSGLTEQKVNQYLAALRSNLETMPPAEREEILREITAHIHDSAEETGSSIETVLGRLGSPQAVAAEYRTDTLMRKAATSFSPLLLLRAAGRLATKTAAGFAVFLCAVVGYSLSCGMILTALLKPFFPRQIGLWVGPHHFTFGFWGQPIGGFGFGLFTSDHVGVRELLGIWYIPVALVIGGLVMLCTSLILRKLLQAFPRHRNQTGMHWRQSVGASQPL